MSFSEHFRLACQAVEAAKKACTTLDALRDINEQVKDWLERIEELIDESNLEGVAKTELWAPKFKELGLDMVCTSYDFSRQEVLKASGSYNLYKTSFALDFLGLGGLDETTTIVVSGSLNDDGCDFDCSLEVNMQDGFDGFEVQYNRSTHYFSLSASSIQGCVPLSLWQALQTIVPLVVMLEQSDDSIEKDFRAWFVGNTIKGTHLGVVALQGSNKVVFDES
jgi:hypothetical protein